MACAIMIEKKESENPWNPEDEREHYPSVLEWWAVESFFRSPTHAGRQQDISAAAFEYSTGIWLHSVARGRRPGQAMGIHGSYDLVRIKMIRLGC